VSSKHLRRDVEDLVPGFKVDRRQACGSVCDSPERSSHCANRVHVATAFDDELHHFVERCRQVPERNIKGCRARRQGSYPVAQIDRDVLRTARFRHVDPGSNPIKPFYHLWCRAGGLDDVQNFVRGSSLEQSVRGGCGEECPVDAQGMSVGYDCRSSRGIEQTGPIPREEQSQDRRTHRGAVAVGSLGVHSLGRRFPPLATPDALENSCRAGTVTTAPEVAGGKALCDRVGLDAVFFEERCGKVECHLRIVCPAKAPLRRSADHTPHEPLEWPALVRRSECIASGETQQATGKLVSGHWECLSAIPKKEMLNDPNYNPISLYMKNIIPL